MNLKSKESSPVVGAKPSPPPPTRPKPVRTAQQGKKGVEEHTEDHYDIPVVISNRTSASFSDSGFKGDWPEPKTKQKSGLS